MNCQQSTDNWLISKNTNNSPMWKLAAFSVFTNIHLRSFGFGQSIWQNKTFNDVILKWWQKIYTIFCHFIDLVNQILADLLVTEINISCSYFYNLPLTNSVSLLSLNFFEYFWIVLFASWNAKEDLFIR